MREDIPFCYIREDKCSGLVTHSHACGIYFKGARIASKLCVKCDLGIQESINHIVMQCPFFEEDRAVMLNELNDTDNGEIKNLLTRSGEIYLYLMGKQPEEYSFDDMYVFWTISARHITAMYKKSYSWMMKHRLFLS